MTSIIKILPDHVVNKIAAGEVVERPASVVKELIENSIDSGATEIIVDIELAGRRLIRVTDNGCGMSREDARTAFVRHATSKISSDEDLEAISTMGFRGEALSSIASVAQTRMLSGVRGADSGVLIEIEGGLVKMVSDAAAPHGTSIEIAHLFYNTPARLKFLKSTGTEFSHIVAAVSRQAMANPSLRFRLTHNAKTVLDLPASASIKERVFQLYGAEIADNVMPFTGGRDGVHVHGIVGIPSYSRADRTYQDFYVNRRAVRNPSLSHALYGAYGGMLMRDRHPIGFIFLDIDPALVDVNVHPAKAEVRFRNQSQVHDLVREAIREGLRTHGMSVSDLTGSAYDHAERVKDDGGDFLKTQETAGLSLERKPSPLFSRRKSDGRTEDLQCNSGQDYRNADYHDLSLQTAIIPEHDLFPVAQIHYSFIIAQSAEGMAIIDQHAAHERVLFEKLQNQFSGGLMSIQNL